VNPPKTSYAKSGDLHIAYQVVGEGAIDVVLVDQWFSHMDGLWDVPPLARLVERLGSFSRVITFDERGIGLSDPVPTTSLPSIEEWMDDLRAVMDTVGSERAAVVAGLAAGFMATVFVATYPERVSALVLVDTFPRFTRTPDYPWGASAEERTQRLKEVEAGWGQGLMLQQFAPSMAADGQLRDAWARYERQAASPGSALAMVDMLYHSDIRAVLPTISVPTLVMARGEAQRIPPAHSRYMAAHISGARYVELPGTDTLMWAGDQDATVGEIQEFLTGVRPVSEPDRVLATVMFTDIVGSTERASRMGDRAWRELLDRHHVVVRQELGRFRGKEIVTAGDGFLATFDGPGRAIRCARSIVDKVRALGLEIRAGLHTGEIELVGDDVRGIAVHIGARVVALAGPGEVLVSSTVRDLVAGSGIDFEDRGAHSLKGITNEWRLFLVTVKST
jgi:class 3 adenylate cyclase